jgi:hypothetical protein
MNLFRNDIVTQPHGQELDGLCKHARVNCCTIKCTFNVLKPSLPEEMDTLLSLAILQVLRMVQILSLFFLLLIGWMSDSNTQNLESSQKNVRFNCLFFSRLCAS